MTNLLGPEALAMWLYKRWARLPLAFALVILIGGVERGGGAWAADTRSSGADPGALSALDREIADGKWGLVDRVLVRRCGQVIFERSYPHDYAKIYGDKARAKGPLNAHLTGPYNYFDSSWHPYYRGSDLHSLQSVTKTMTSVVYGVAVTRGDFKASLDTPVLHWFPKGAVREIDARKKRMTLRHVLTMSTGLEWNEDVAYDDPKNTATGMEASSDWVSYVIDRPMAGEPGTAFAYNSGASELLSFIFQAETGQDIERYAELHLFRQLGIERHYWKRNPKGAVDTEGGLYLSAPDLAKIGTLFLQGGKWQNKAIIRSDWVADSVKPAFEARGEWRYGYLWWLSPRDGAVAAYAARGFGGQLLYVMPDKDLVLVMNGWTIPNSKGAEGAVIKAVITAVDSKPCQPDKS
jgi:CubicO group peptidase (beta-lactamase class C family)